MNWKKLLLIAVVAAGFVFASASSSEAGRVSVGIGIGFPVGYAAYGYGPYYGYPGYYPYGYYPPPPLPYVRVPVVFSTPGYYWYHGRRIYYGRPCR